MKIKSTISVVFIVLNLLDTSMAASVIFDDFTSGPFSIASNATTRDTSLITSPIAESRWARGSGSDNWNALIDVVLSELTYTVSEPISSTRFAVTYSHSSGSLNLTGFNSFVLHVDNLIGFGQVYVFEGSSSNLMPLPQNLWVRIGT